MLHSAPIAYSITAIRESFNFTFYLRATITVPASLPSFHNPSQMTHYII